MEYRMILCQEKMLMTTSERFKLLAAAPGRYIELPPGRWPALKEADGCNIRLAPAAFSHRNECSSPDGFREIPPIEMPPGDLDDWLKAGFVELVQEKVDGTRIYHLTLDGSKKAGKAGGQDADE